MCWLNRPNAWLLELKCKVHKLKPMTLSHLWICYLPDKHQPHSSHRPASLPFSFQSLSLHRTATPLLPFTNADHDILLSLWRSQINLSLGLPTSPAQHQVSSVKLTKSIRTEAKEMEADCSITRRLCLIEIGW